MSSGFVVLCFAAVAMFAAATSAVVGIALWAGDSALRRLHPEARVRLLLAAAFAPLTVGFAVIAGWITDFHFLGCEHHRCVADHGAAMPPLLAFALAAFFAARLGIAATRAGLGLWHTTTVRRALDNLADADGRGLRELPLDDPLAFVVGFMHPQVYVSEGLVRATGSDLEPVLAHERAHARRRDPLQRLVAVGALAFHLPGVAAAIEHRLTRAQECTADADAARELGDRPRLAEILVRCARLRVRRTVASAAAWLGGDLEARVLELLDAPEKVNQPRASLLTASVLGLFVAAVIAAEPIHTLAERLLDLLAG